MPDQVSAEMAQVLSWICTEIGAGKTFERSQVGEVHNNACDRAISIVRSYARGEGLFQMTRKTNEAVSDG